MKKKYNVVEIILLGLSVILLILGILTIILLLKTSKEIEKQNKNNNTISMMVR